MIIVQRQVSLSFESLDESTVLYRLPHIVPGSIPDVDAHVRQILTFFLAQGLTLTIHSLKDRASLKQSVQARFRQVTLSCSRIFPVWWTKVMPALDGVRNSIFGVNCKSDIC